MDYGLQGKTVLITAASKGLGFATAKQFAAEGAHVMLSSRSELSLRAAADEIMRETGNHNVSYCTANVAHREEIENLFDEVERKFGGADILINNAGGPPQGNFEVITEEQWADAFELTLMSTVRTFRRAIPHMRKSGWGRVVNFTSSSIKQPLDNLILSNTYRAAIVGLSKSLSTQLAPDNILVNVLGPGRIATDRVAEIDASRAQQLGISTQEVEQESKARIPLGRYGTPEEFAAMAVFLGSSANGYITGQAILVDGGLVRSL